MAAGHTNEDIHLSVISVSICLSVHPPPICLSISHSRLLFNPSIQSYLLEFILFSLPFACLWVQPGIRTMASIQANFIQLGLSQVMV